MDPPSLIAIDLTCPPILLLKVLHPTLQTTPLVLLANSALGSPTLRCRTSVVANAELLVPQAIIPVLFIPILWTVPISLLLTLAALMPPWPVLLADVAILVFLVVPVPPHLLITVLKPPLPPQAAKQLPSRLATLPRLVLSTLLSLLAAELRAATLTETTPQDMQPPLKQLCSLSLVTLRALFPLQWLQNRSRLPSASRLPIPTQSLPSTFRESKVLVRKSLAPPPNLLIRLLL